MAFMKSSRKSKAREARSSLFLRRISALSLGALFVYLLAEVNGERHGVYRPRRGISGSNRYFRGLPIQRTAPSIQNMTAGAQLADSCVAMHRSRRQASSTRR